MPGPVTFTDDMGNEVTVDNPQRVVACMGSFANAWELAGGTLVGVSDDALTAAGWTIESPDVATVGDFTAVNLEAIMALNPDFVIMTSGTGGRGGDSSQADLRDALVGAGIPVAYFEVTTFDDYERLMRTFTDITGRADLYDQNVAKVAAAIDAVVGAVPAENPPTALLLTTFSGGTRVQSSGTQTGAMLADLGVNNLADENKSLLKDFSLEAVIEMHPDFIFVIPMGNDTEAAMRNLEEATAANPAWGSLSAVQNGRYITLTRRCTSQSPTPSGMRPTRGSSITSTGRTSDGGCLAPWVLSPATSSSLPRPPSFLRRSRRRRSCSAPPR